jgi:hypothetical protein
VTTRDEKRRAAVRNHEERIAAEEKRKADVEAARQGQEQKLRQAEQNWLTNASQTIRAGVLASSNGFAHQGCNYVIGGPDNTTPFSLGYRIVPSGRPTRTEAEFSFALRDGSVCPATTARGCEDFPSPVPVGDVTQDWVEDVADSVMTALLGGQRIRIPD